MAVAEQAFPRLDSQAVDPATGRLTRPWHRFLIALWERSGGGVGYDVSTISAQAADAFFDEAMGDVADPQLAIQNEAIIGLFVGDDLHETPTSLDFMPWDEGPSEPCVAAVQPVTVSTSPVSFTSRVVGNLLISGGTISALTMARGATTTTLPATLALLPLSPGDTASVTYSAAPTITFIPR